MAKKNKGGNAILEWYGFDELLRSIDDASENLEVVVRKSLIRSSKPVEKDMKTFIDSHSPGGSRASVWATGDTRASWVGAGETFKSKDGVMSVTIGYDLKKSLAPVFLEYGGMHNPPYYFTNDAVNKNATTVEKIQEDTIKELIAKLAKGERI